MSNGNITHYLELGRARNTNTGRAHARAMAAKECIFLAQDAVSAAWQEGAPGPKRRAALKRFERRLAKVRAELEQLDNDWLAFAREVTP